MVLGLPGSPPKSLWSGVESELTVKSTTGIYTGIQDADYNIRVFRNIPYAKPPVGKLRWKPPVARRPSREHHYSYRYPPPCSQYLSNYTAGDMAQTSSEDCLSLAIWTPINATHKSKLPVGLFVPGGSFKTGGLSVPYYNPAGWINRTQQHIMVSINYRVNNVGVLDQRLALECFRLFLMSGTAMRTFAQGDNALQSNFSFVAKKVGCDFPGDAEAELDCMQQVPATLISNFAGHYSDKHTKPSLFFRPTADNKLIFENYTEQARRGLMSRIPALVSVTSNEQSSLIEYPINNLCPAFNTSSVRADNNLTTYRYEYVGEFPNITPYKWMGAYHGADLPMIFGTYNMSGNATDFQREVSERMQDYVSAFLADPQHGLAKLGWAPSDVSSAINGTMIRFGEAGSIMKNISSVEVDNACLR
ncbi:Alpha/Beta hydrolase protein [Astrocystis sublimbata]|nr:Alpha/Beta hydrolase protein [Astrocystis sublimbata]